MELFESEFIATVVLVSFELWRRKIGVSLLPKIDCHESVKKVYMKDILYLYQLECCKYLVENKLQRRYDIYFASSADFSCYNAIGFVI